MRLTLRSLAAFCRKLACAKSLGSAEVMIKGIMTHPCKLEDFCGEIFEDCGNIDSCLSSNSHLVLGVVF